MFYVASKTLAWFLEPVSWFLLFNAMTLWLLYRRRYRATAAVLAVNTVLIFSLTQLPVADMLVRPLEQAFQTPADLPKKIDGIIVLGGLIWAANGKPHLTSEGERLTEFLALARRYPEARLVFTGGASSPELSPETEAVKLFLIQQGFDPANVIFEDRSKNTYENAVYAQQLVRPNADEKWVLITSASHMPRAYSVFRKIGWDVIPYPVSYRGFPNPQFLSGDKRLETLKMAIHEWVGIAVYRLSSRM